MIGRFLKYSLENKRKIAVVLQEEGTIKKINLLVTAIGPKTGRFTAVLSGRRKESVLSTGDILTADYARGDHGELE